MTGLVLAAAGSGSRFGSEIPKQFLEFDGRPLFLHSLNRLLPFVEQAVVVVPPLWKDRMTAVLSSLDLKGRVLLEGGGKTRQISVFNGLQRLDPGVEFVLVHDAARPFVSSRLVSSILETTRRDGACIPALPVADTVKEVAQGRVIRTLERKRIFLAQTPQGFKVSILRQAYEKASLDRFEGTDEASLVERIGVPVSVVPGEAENRKITFSDDL